ncbi:hypothetical protein LADH09A_003891 [Micromonospora sp. LAH09]|uniref:hypothetical protein n=1 Tax=Micromonospora cabrerizensis TaxID=2911213 RepID=UPI001EE94F94|nr:hypothetical protein [Micromonospora cabrerizensis]MCG5469951.1 hypothetical protein [Micromonospora cabrerizensis]
MSTVAQVRSYSRPAVRALIVAQFAAIGAFLAVLLLYLGRMATAGVGPAEMLTGAYDPKDVLSFGLHAVVGMLYVVGAVLGLPLAVAAVAVVAREREALPRVTRALLLTGAVGGLLLLVVRFTPPLLDMHSWWMD